jgi:uncharacterized membrane protein
MDFSIQSCVSFGWETFKNRPWFFVGASVVIALIYLVAGSLTSAIDRAFSGTPEGPSLIGSLLNLGLSNVINMGVTAFYLSAHDSPEAVDLSPFWHPRPFWTFLGATLLLSLAIVLGMILLIIPGIIFALMFMFTLFIVIDRELGPIEAMKESARITRGYKWQLLGLCLVLTAIGLLGLLAFLVGVLVAMPITSLAFAHAYRVLSERASAPRALTGDAAL